MGSVFNRYTDVINEQLKHGKRRSSNFQKADSLGDVGGLRAFTRKLSTTKEQDQVLYESIQQPLATIAKKAKYDQKLGLHPDFAYLKTTDSVENHYVTSAFVDIKGSTGLFKKYEALTVANITTTIQKVAIHACWTFDGYVQRLHGDGLFLYFGGKKTTIKDSVLSAIHTATLFNNFVENDLAQMFEENGVDQISTRIGIDSGEAEDVVWHLAGAGDCSEVTTCSLHTSLAAKMQANAVKNGVMIGDNVKRISMLDPQYFSIKKDSKGIEDRYIFEIEDEGFRYTQWDFDWKNYLAKQLTIQQKATISPTQNLQYLEKQASSFRPSSLSPWTSRPE